MQLQDLPEAVLVEVARCSRREEGHPLLGVSRGCRDTVLGSFSKLFLTPLGDDFQSQARLLDRACCKASPGLQLTLELYQLYRHNRSSCSYALCQLLQPGCARGGWANVHDLEVSSE
jgi:hypothetical protein